MYSTVGSLASPRSGLRRGASSYITCISTKRYVAAKFDFIPVN